MSEQLIPLSEEDRQLLNQLRKVALVWALGLGTVSLVLSLLLIPFHTFTWLVLIICFAFASAMGALARLYNLRLVAKDLRGSQKKMITGPVEAQNVDVTRQKDEDGVEGAATYRFWIQIGGKKVTVSEDQYYQFKKGDLAKAFIAPHSETVLGVNKEILTRPFS